MTNLNIGIKFRHPRRLSRWVRSRQRSGAFFYLRGNSRRKSSRVDPRRLELSPIGEKKALTSSKVIRCYEDVLDAAWSLLLELPGKQIPYLSESEPLTKCGGSHEHEDLQIRGSASMTFSSGSFGLSGETAEMSAQERRRKLLLGGRGSTYMPVCKRSLSPKIIILKIYL